MDDGRKLLEVRPEAGTVNGNSLGAIWATVELVQGTIPSDNGLHDGVPSSVDAGLLNKVQGRGTGEAQAPLEALASFTISVRVGTQPRARGEASRRRELRRNTRARASPGDVLNCPNPIVWPFLRFQCVGCSSYTTFPVRMTPPRLLKNPSSKLMAE